MSKQPSFVSLSLTSTYFMRLVCPGVVTKGWSASLAFSGMELSTGVMVGTIATVSTGAAALNVATVWPIVTAM